MTTTLDHNTQLAACDEMLAQLENRIDHVREQFDLLHDLTKNEAVSHNMQRTIHRSMDSLNEARSALYDALRDARWIHGQAYYRVHKEYPEDWDY